MQQNRQTNAKAIASLVLSCASMILLYAMVHFFGNGSAWHRIWNFGTSG